MELDLLNYIGSRRGETYYFAMNTPTKRPTKACDTMLVGSALAGSIPNGSACCVPTPPRSQTYLHRATTSLRRRNDESSPPPCPRSPPPATQCGPSPPDVVLRHHRLQSVFLFLIRISSLKRHYNISHLPPPCFLSPQHVSPSSHSSLYSSTSRTPARPTRPSTVVGGPADEPRG